MTNEFSFEPYVGTNLVKFGMKPDEVEHLLGPAQSVDSNVLGECAEQRGPVGVRYDKSSEEVVEIAFVPAHGFFFEVETFLKSEMS